MTPASRPDSVEGGVDVCQNTVGRDGVCLIIVLVSKSCLILIFFKNYLIIEFKGLCVPVHGIPACVGHGG